ncbi:MAG TPA: hypothetical protein VL096_11515 [Pirellulaceae bacterium]|nr:hypothetical protein [Pirellulaceae bacterium]
MYLIGTDEAGYGPNLGPLVVSATLWRVPDELASADLYELLADYVCAGVVKADDARLPIADSKRLYSSGESWAQLEIGLLTALCTLQQPYRTWQELWQTLSPGAQAELTAEPWHQGFELATPRDVDADQIEERAAGFAAGLTFKKVELCAIASRPVFASEFNRLCAEHGNKSSVLSHVTLALVRDLITQHKITEPLLVSCDKHGGRNFYAALLQHHFPDDLVVVQTEGRERSVYRAGPAERVREFRFIAKGEGFLPAALASMACKYLREMAMHAFNLYWQQRVPSLKPTAGYPEDAKRFRRDIAAAQAKHGIADDVLWRKK